ncbi:MAG: hypothetical protein LBT20_03870 [Clostridiales bacterium]|jgi:hypothetical protein|nr:hypothetical protein [Clostridiales bacterium]
MKKSKRLWLIVSACVAAAAVIAVAAVALFADSEIDLGKNISYMDKYAYFGSNANFAVTVNAGVGEKTFLTDGKVGETAEFCKISLVVVNSSYTKLESFGYELTAGGEKLSGTFKKDVLTLEFNDQTAIKNPETVESVVIVYATTHRDTISLANMLEGRLSATDAVDAAVKVFAKEIKSNTKNKIFPREIYVKFVTGYGGEEPYYWYVAFIASETDFWAVLLDSRTGAVDVKKG